MQLLMTYMYIWAWMALNVLCGLSGDIYNLSGTCIPVSLLHTCKTDILQVGNKVQFCTFLINNIMYRKNWVLTPSCSKWATMTAVLPSLLGARLKALNTIPYFAWKKVQTRLVTF